MFISEKEEIISKDYLENGYTIQNAANEIALTEIRESICNIVKEILNDSSDDKPDEILNNIHKKVSVDKLNEFRLKVIQKMNSIEKFRLNYFLVAKPFLDTLVGNELSMQLRVNLSIQFPNDNSSLLPLHSDTWSGDSPYEIVVWLPLVDCYNTKAMYLLPPENYSKLKKDFKNKSVLNSEELFLTIKDEVNFLKVNYGQVLLFDQGLPHGNRINLENETRWSMNCRFKGVFTPYGDKKIGEFFEPITLKATSKIGMNYTYPSIK